MDDNGEDDDFNLIQPTLIQQLKNILDQYPDNGQILKEIIQNAEDAGAKKVRFLYDENDVSTIFGQGINELQGPSLYSYNDAYFRKEDWKGIRMFGKSLKEKDPLKVGRFGLGFKSTFHLTDNPTIMSDRILGIINPDENLFSSARERRTGKVLDFCKQPFELTKSQTFHEDCSDVYKDILHTDVKNGICKGSLFRFNLRREPSELSKTAYNRNKVIELFESFKGEGHLALIFMKNLEKIEFFIRKKDEANAELVYSFSIADENRQETLQRKEEFVHALEQAQGRNNVLRERSLAFETNILAREMENGVLKSEKIFTYSVVHYFAGRTLSEDVSMNEIAEELGLMPLVGIAHPRQQDLPTGAHIFCTLPLPILGNTPTSLPVHLNGFFALGPDRKDLKWPSTSELQCSDKQVLWNQFLIQKALPSAYEVLFGEMIAAKLPSDVIYSAFPDLSVVDKKWKKVAEAFFLRIFTQKCLWTEASDGKWILPKDALFVNMIEKDKTGLVVAFDCLIRCCIPAVNLPRHVEFAFSKLYDPSNTRNFIESKIVRRELQNRPRTIEVLQYEKRMELISYLVSCPKDIEELVEVAILPLENGSFAAVRNCYHSERIYISSTSHPKSLLPGFESKLLKTNINQKLLDIFTTVAKQGKLQLAMLTEDIVADNIKDVFVYDQVESTISLKSNLHEQTTAEWLCNIWQYVKKFNLLSKLNGKPVIPLEVPSESKNKIACTKVSDQSTVLYLNDNRHESLATFMSFLGFIVVRKLPEYILDYTDLFRGAIYKLTAKDILSLFINISKIQGVDNFVRRFKAYKDKPVKTELLKLIGDLTYASHDLLSLIKKLPIFENSLTEELNSIEEVNIVAPQNMPTVNPRTKLLRCIDAASRNLALKLGAKLLTNNQLISDIIIPEMLDNRHDNRSIDEFMKYILPGNFLHQFPSLREIRFVPAANSERYKPNELFSPSDEILKILFSHDSGKFPAEMYKEEAYLHALKMLGLKSAKELSAKDIHQILRSIEQTESVDQAKQKAKVLVGYIERYPNILCSETIESLKNIPWIPVMHARPTDYPENLTWLAEKNNNKVFEKPVNMTNEANARLLGGVKLLFSNKYSNKIMKKHVFHSDVTLTDVLKQLQYVINDYKEQYRPEYVLIIKEIYLHLLGCDVRHVNTKLQMLCLHDWVWNGEGFESPEKFVVDFSGLNLELSPYIWPITSEMKKFKEMFLQFGAKRTCTIQMLIKVLEEMKENYDQDSSKHIENAVKNDLKLAVEIISKLSEKTLSSDLREKLCVPIHTNKSLLKFELADNTVYCPNFNYSAYEYEVTEDVNYLHNMINENVATSLGIRSLTSKILGAEDLGMFEEYGQEEPLTRRINRILQDYGDGSAIIKELIQNADDAGATQVKLLFDERQNRHHRTSLIDPGMQDFQGPALWAYNNATFSKQDFENITKLSGATKECQRDKIGKFGLGFNAVYNITDVPSFISGNHLVIFDPHTTNLGRAISNKSKPGVKINIGTNRSRLKHFKDQLAPYDKIFGMDMRPEIEHKPFQGTLFRFPLRTRQQAMQSEIKKLCYDQDEMKRLLTKFASEANKILIFTQHVSQIKVFHLKENASSPVDMEELITAEKATIKEIIPLVVNGEKFEVSEIMKVSALSIDKARGNEAIYRPIRCSNILSLNLNISSVGKGYFKDQILHNSKDKWLIHSVSDTVDSKCLELAFEHSKLNPVASIALSIEEDDSLCGKFSFTPLNDKSNAGHYFCFLPMPISNDLPVHTNGTFAITHDRKSLHQVNEDDKYSSTIETRWNHALMAGPISDAYLGILEDLKKLANNSEESKWYELWPTVSAVSSPYRKSLLKSFYQNLVKRRLRLMPAFQIQKWVDWEEAMIIDPNLDEDIKASMEKIIETYIKNRTVIHLPKNIINSVAGVGLENELKNITITFEDFFNEIFQRNIKCPNMIASARDNVVLFLLKNLKNYQNLRPVLIETECIPTMPNKTLKSPNQLVRRNSKASLLFEVSDEVFPFGENFNQWSHLKTLESLGMISDEISWEILISRASTVISLENQETAIRRSSSLIKLIDEKLTQDSLIKISENWRNIRFLPIKAAPDSFTDLPWAGKSSKDRYMFHNIEGIYPSRLEDLVCCHSPIIDESDEGCGKLSRKILQFFNIPTEATLAQVCHQIDQIISLNLEATKNHVKKILLSIYKYLDDYCRKNNSENFEKIRLKFKEHALLVVGNKLTQKDFVASKHSYPSEPYLYQLPENMFRYQSLIAKLKVKEKYDLDDYVFALKRIEEDHHHSQLQDKDIKLVRNILESIDNFKSEQGIFVFLPDNKGILHPKQDVHVKDARWIPDDPSQKYIHPQIPDTLALSLGAKTVRSHSISKQSIGMPFGQHEKLTVRLKKILDGYPGEIQILHEILQNADDAGATKLEIILDKQTHPSTRIFGGAWKALQGPAILFCNNAPFTESDLQGIQNLGEGSKSNDPLKTGQFGVGFNVVYHVTDVPTLLTHVEGQGSILCIFDPHAKYLDGCSLTEPGRMFSDARNYLEEQFPDVYQTFLPNILRNNKSTIFRLPIRNENMANESKIKSEPISTDKLRAMLEKFKREAADSMLFLKHIESLDLSEINEKGKLERLCSIQLKYSPGGKNEKTHLNKEHKLIASSLSENSRENVSDNFATHSYDLIVKDSSKTTKWHIIQKVASVNNNSLPDSIEEHYKKGLLRIFPSGGIACSMGKTTLGNNGKVFCLLPLQISSSLPLNINGNFILDYETRRKLWFSKDSCFQNDWNNYVIANCIIPCYIALLEKQSKLLRMIKLSGTSGEEVIMQLSFYCPDPPTPG